MEATVQAQQVNVQQAAGYYRTQAGGASGLVAVQGVETAQNQFSALLDQLLGSGMESLQPPKELLEALEEQKNEADLDAAMQLLAQLFGMQPNMVQQVNPELLAQLTGQAAQAAQPIGTQQQATSEALCALN